MNIWTEEKDGWWRGVKETAEAEVCVRVQQCGGETKKEGGQQLKEISAYKI